MGMKGKEIPSLFHHGFPPVPQGVFGVCEGCGAVAWELLDGASTMCLGCDPAAYRHDDEIDEEEGDWVSLIEELRAEHRAATPGTHEYTATQMRVAAAIEAKTLLTPDQLRRLADDVEAGDA